MRLAAAQSMGQLNKCLVRAGAKVTSGPSCRTTILGMKVVGLASGPASPTAWERTGVAGDASHRDFLDAWLGTAQSPSGVPTSPAGLGYRGEILGTNHSASGWRGAGLGDLVEAGDSGIDNEDDEDKNEDEDEDDEDENGDDDDDDDDDDGDDEDEDDEDEDDDDGDDDTTVILASLYRSFASACRPLNTSSQEGGAKDPAAAKVCMGIGTMYERPSAALVSTRRRWYTDGCVHEAGAKSIFAHMLRTDSNGAFRVSASSCVYTKVGLDKPFLITSEEAWLANLSIALKIRW